MWLGSSWFLLVVAFFLVVSALLLFVTCFSLFMGFSFWDFVHFGWVFVGCWIFLIVFVSVLLLFLFFYLSCYSVWTFGNLVGFFVCFRLLVFFCCFLG